MERFVVRQYLYPAFSSTSALSFSDQFAFRPTGSTSAALISLLQTITTHLENNPYVLVYALDFSKAFDCVRHTTLMQKLSQLIMPDYVYNWIVDFFSERAHCTRHKQYTSSKISINASVVQGSALGPACFIINAADMTTVYKENSLNKYADDTYLIVPASRADTVEQELANIKSWSAVNNLRLNQSKSAEIVFVDPNRKTQSAVPPPPPRPGIPRVETIKVLGVTLTNRLSMTKHVDATIAACGQTLFALKTLRAHGLNNNSLQTVFKSVAVAKLQYASAAWRGYTSAQDRDRLESFLRKSTRAGFYAPASPTFDDLSVTSESRFFRKIVGSEDHILHKLLPPKTKTRYSLRQRAHNFVLPQRTTSLNDRNFFMRMLFGH